MRTGENFLYACVNLHVRVGTKKFRKTSRAQKRKENRQNLSPVFGIAKSPSTLRHEEKKTTTKEKAKQTNKQNEMLK